MLINKKSFQNIFKNLFYSLFKFYYGKIEGVEKKQSSDIDVKIVKTEEGLNYNVYSIHKGRLYTDRINDTAILKSGKIVEGPSFQFRTINSSVINSNIEKNIVFSKGTPRIQKKIKGKILSLLTGGGGNDNYWHWLFDVIPRIALCEKVIDLNKINFFLLPDNKRRFQKETLEILKIGKERQLSSVNFRHIVCDELYATSHPVVRSGNATIDIQTTPKWISNWLRKKFLKKNNNLSYKKIYIDRSDSLSNVKHLRKIKNEEEVKEYLVDQNFKILKLSELSFKDQVSVFNNAEVIVGHHGAGFANIVFSKPNAKVVEIKSKSDKGKVIENLASSNNLSCEVLKCDLKSTDYANQFGDIEVSINKLKEVLL